MTDGVVLREVVAADLPVFFSHQQDEGAVHMAAFVSRDPTDRDVFDAHWARTMGDPAILIRTILAGGEVVGHIAKFERDGEPEITYWIDRAYWGRGVATSALRLFLGEVTQRPLYAGAAQDNVGSLRVLEKCGFSVCGHDRGFAGARGEEIDETRMRLG